MATATTGSQTQTSSTGDGGNKNINILNTGANAVITVGCGCGDSASSGGSGSGTTEEFQQKPTTDDCESGKIILLETGDESSEIAAGYSMLSVLKSELTGGVHTLQFALCGGTKAVEIPNGVENLAQTERIQYEATYTDGKSTYTGKLLTGAFCLLRAKITSTEAFRIGITVFNTGCGSEQQQDCQYGIINIFKGAMVGKAAFGTPFTIVADSQNKVGFALCDGEKKLTDFGFLSAGQPIDVWVDDQHFATDAEFHDALPICGTNFAVNNCKSATFTIKNEICGTECETCGDPKEEVVASRFLNKDVVGEGGIVIKLGQPIAGTFQYEMTIQLPPDIGAKDCLVDVAMDWMGGNLQSLTPAWNAPGWQPGGHPPIGEAPSAEHNTTILGYKLQGTTLKLTIAIIRHVNDGGWFIRVGAVTLGVCQ